LKFLGKIALSERSELRFYRKENFNQAKISGEVGGVLSFAYFSLHKQRKVRSPSAKTDLN